MFKVLGGLRALDSGDEKGNPFEGGILGCGREKGFDVDREWRWKKLLLKGGGLGGAAVPGNPKKKTQFQKKSTARRDAKFDAREVSY